MKYWTCKAKFTCNTQSYFSSDLLLLRNVSNVSLGFGKTPKLQKRVSKLSKKKSNIAIPSLIHKRLEENNNNIKNLEYQQCNIYYNSFFEFSSWCY